MNNNSISEGGMVVQIYSPEKMNILLGLENQSFHSQKVLHQSFRMNANNNQNTWAGRIKNFKEGKILRSLAHNVLMIEVKKGYS